MIKLQILQLENPNDLLERLKYLKHLKGLNEIKKSQIKDTQELLKNEIDFSNKLSERISNYNIYPQQENYFCSSCKELVKDCACKYMEESFTKGSENSNVDILKNIEVKIEQQPLSELNLRNIQF